MIFLSKYPHNMTEIPDLIIEKIKDYKYFIEWRSKINTVCAEYYIKCSYKDGQMYILSERMQQNMPYNYRTNYKKDKFIFGNSSYLPLARLPNILL
jgi:hypothetical protein